MQIINDIITTDADISGVAMKMLKYICCFEFVTFL